MVDLEKSAEFAFVCDDQGERKSSSGLRDVRVGESRRNSVGDVDPGDVNRHSFAIQRSHAYLIDSEVAQKIHD